MEMINRFPCYAHRAHGMESCYREGLMLRLVYLQRHQACTSRELWRTGTPQTVHVQVRGSTPRRQMDTITTTHLTYEYSGLGSTTST